MRYFPGTRTELDSVESGRVAAERLQHKDGDLVADITVSCQYFEPVFLLE